MFYLQSINISYLKKKRYSCLFFCNTYTFLSCYRLGPGLGRDAVVLYIAEKAISLAKANSIPIVVDADGLFLVSQKPEIVIGYKNAILTPNITEYRYLCKSVGADESESVIDIAKRFGGLTIFQKGKIDRISNGTEYYEGTDEGCPRRYNFFCIYLFIILFGNSVDVDVVDKEMFFREQFLHSYQF